LIPELFSSPPNDVKFIFNFEISPKVAFFVVTILIGSYITFSVSELFDERFQADYYGRVKAWIENFTVTKIGNEGVFYYFQVFLGDSSKQIFGSIKAIPLISSTALIVLTYFTTVEITKKKFAGIVAMIIVMQSGVFLHYHTSITYPNFWILFYLLSLYLIYKKSILSPISYIASFFAKLFTTAFLPMTLFFIYRANISRSKKIRLMIFYATVIIAGALILIITDTRLTSAEFEFDAHDFWAGFNAIHTSLRLDSLVLLFILPLIVGLFLTSRRGIKEADSIMFLILGMLLSAVFVPALSGVINVPYRFIPLVVFFAIGVGVLLSKKIVIK